MNFYKHHIGDYAQATGHLSFVEDAAYTRMLRKYYAEEKPLPPDVNKVIRLVGARTREERQAVQTVLDEFFLLQDDGYHNKRCDQEIMLAREFEEVREEKSANERERQRRHREERRKLFEALRDLDIVPAFDTKTETLRELLRNALDNVTVTQQNTDASQNVTLPVTRTDTANQKPVASNQKPEDLTPPLPPSADAEHSRANGHDLLGDRAHAARVPHEDIIAIYHEILPMCPRVAAWSDKRKRLLKARWTDDPERQSLDWWRGFFAWVAESKFLTGRAPPTPPRTVPFLASLEWLLTESNFLKVIEGCFNREANAA